jgi:hypothetical protein
VRAQEANRVEALGNMKKKQRESTKRFIADLHIVQSFQNALRAYGFTMDRYLPFPQPPPVNRSLQDLMSKPMLILMGDEDGKQQASQ